ncbi:HD domain-containing protein [Streptosporangium sp. NPDC000396]|uniref:HD domain-containing protein n=1 Tax=Streptosporangium sp. NPDC000396 TaxID=3366185 RepID=UPI0036A25B50
MTFTLDDARLLAHRAHDGQTDKSGRPYIHHPVAVSAALEPYGLQAQIAGMLHDVIEDTEVTAEDLLAAGVEPYTVEAILSVTRGEGEPYDDFVRRSAAHPLGRIVKRADLGHNSSPERLAMLAPDKAASLKRKYDSALRILDETEAR